MDQLSLAKKISLIENGSEEILDILASANPLNTPIIGITGPPGAGKSSLVDALTQVWVNAEKKVAILCIDPSSPFHSGALLGDRIRMNKWFNNPNVFIRSLATRGALGGLHPKIIEITELVKSFGFDYIIIETVGVGQSEVEIAGLADICIVAIVPEAGDEIQTMKSGIMEIADIFVVNKADRPGADQFVNNLKLMLAPAFTSHSMEVPVLKTIATTNEGIELLETTIQQLLKQTATSDKKINLLAEKAYHLIRQERMRDINKIELKEKIKEVGNDFNLYRFVKQFKK